MPGGLLCKHCGWQETDHQCQTIATKRRGYRFSLDNCPGYECNKKDLPTSRRILKEIEVDNRSGR